LKGKRKAQSVAMWRDPENPLKKDVKEQQRGFRKFTGGAGGMRLATIMLIAILAVGALGMLAYFASDGTSTASNPPAVQKDQAAIPAPRDTETLR
jgi:hypothetical protein